MIEELTPRDDNGDLLQIVRNDAMTRTLTEWHS